jgi:ABC-type transport system involved in multi-copper enzyme maturation permease subunit
MMQMLTIEIRRCFDRKLVRWLVILAVVGCALAAFFAYRAASNADDLDQFRLVDIHKSEGDSFIGVGAFFLVIGAVLGGASMIGAEWRAGTFVTLLTWQPHRRRVAIAKLLACGLVATAIAIALQALLLTAFLPAAWGPGTVGAVDAEWWRSVMGGVLRVAGLTGLAAVFAAAVAMIGRSTAAALGAAFAYMLVFENLVRAWKPWSARYLIGENGAVFITGADLETAPFSRSTMTAGLTLASYVAVLTVIAVVSFWRRDLASPS